MQDRRDSRLYAELKQAKDTSANPVELILKSCVIFCNSSNKSLHTISSFKGHANGFLCICVGVFSMILVLLTLLPIAALVIGE